MILGAIVLQRQWIHLIELECPAYCFVFQFKCSIVQQCAVQLLCRQWCLRQKCVTHHTRTRPALSFVFLLHFAFYIFTYCDHGGDGEGDAEDQSFDFKKYKSLLDFWKRHFPKKKLECDVNLIQIRPITSKEFILRFTDENFLINLSRLKIGPTARGEIESFCPTRDWGENHSNLKSTVLTWVREALGRSNPITAHGIV